MNLIAIAENRPTNHLGENISPGVNISTLSIALLGFESLCNIASN